MCSSATRCMWRSSLRPLSQSVRGRGVASALDKAARFPSNENRYTGLVRLFTYDARKPNSDPSRLDGQTHRKEVQNRINELEKSAVEQYPRVDAESQLPCALHVFAARYSYLEPDQIKDDDGPIVISGRISSVRKSGGKLAFVDITEEPGHHKVQIMMNLNVMQSCERAEFAEHIRLIRRGDIISARGFPCRTSSGELSLRASELTRLLSPCLHTIPLGKVQADLSADSDLLDKHVEMLADPSIIQTLMVRTKLIQAMRKFLDTREFCEVQTPIVAAAAGGATAKPFETKASDLPGKKLALRIAPELWLKRLILGGMTRIYEIGPSFRNEGFDHTHNPEFTTCEFYAIYHTLPQLQRMTEELLRNISVEIGDDISDRISHSSLGGDSDGRFAEIDFIPSINAHLPKPLPNLSSPTARAEVLDLFAAQSIPVPAIPTLPRLLDKLCSHFLEPQCIAPTWIINTPECLSPLAKSYVHPTAPNAQPVAARAELFINEKEVVNCYEEENSPFEQRRKFVEQQMHAQSCNNDRSMDATSTATIKDDEAMKIDENYLQALEWGLPPTGGWGCGIDRLAMLFTGKSRISEVLTFGSLRAVSRGAEKSKT